MTEYNNKPSNKDNFHLELLIEQPYLTKLKDYGFTILYKRRIRKVMFTNEKKD